MSENKEEDVYEVPAMDPNGLPVAVSTADGKAFQVYVRGSKSEQYVFTLKRIR